MDRLGLNHDDLRTYQRALVFTHERRIHVQVLDLDMNVQRSLTPMVVDGQVTIDTTADVSRILTLSFLDPARALAFEPDSAGPALWRSRLLRVIYSVRVPDLGDWVDCPVFTGPVWDFDRQGALVNVTAHGMERLALGQAWNPKVYQAKSLRTDALKNIMSRYAGDNCHAIPDLGFKFPHDFHVIKTAQPWKRAKSIAQSMNRHLFYDGHGTLHLRHFNDGPVFTFDDELLTQPRFTRSKDPIINTVEVIGAKPKGKKKRVRAVATAPGWLSPSALGRGWRAAAAGRAGPERPPPVGQGSHRRRQAAHQAPRAAAGRRLVRLPARAAPPGERPGPGRVHRRRSRPPAAASVVDPARLR
jgi:hypothetical protein